MRVPNPFAALKEFFSMNTLQFNKNFGLEKFYGFAIISKKFSKVVPIHTDLDGPIVSKKSPLHENGLQLFKRERVLI